MRVQKAAIDFLSDPDVELWIKRLQATLALQELRIDTVPLNPQLGINILIDGEVWWMKVLCFEADHRDIILGDSQLAECDDYCDEGYIYRLIRIVPDKRTRNPVRYRIIQKFAEFDDDSYAAGFSNEEKVTSAREILR